MSYDPSQAPRPDQNGYPPPANPTYPAQQPTTPAGTYGQPTSGGAAYGQPTSGGAPYGQPGAAYPPGAPYGQAPSGPGAPYGQPGAPYGAPPPAPPRKGTNGLAIAGFILAFLAAPIGFILSIAGLIMAGKKGQKGKGLAVAGIILGLIFSITGVVAVVAASKTVAKLADPGCLDGKAVVLAHADKIADADTGKTHLQALIEGLNAASAKAKHDDVRTAMKNLADDYSSLLQSENAGTVPDSSIISKVGTDAAAIDTACTLGAK